MHRTAGFAFVIAGCFWVAGLVQESRAAPTFFVQPGLNPTLNQGWQASAASPIFEQDFDSYPDTTALTSFPVGGYTVNVSLPNVTPQDAVIFVASFGPYGGQYGTVWQSSLGSFNSQVTDREMLFQLSAPVEGFSLWVFDDAGSTPDSFTMIVNGVESSILDFNPGMTNYTVEGFLGVVDPAGITQVIVRNQTNGLFEIDHVEVFANAVPEPTTGVLVLCAAGFLLANGLRRRALKEK
ncbi:MAG: hypothetical protein WD063_17535 [Pirellulales bacterium]